MPGTVVDKVSVKVIPDLTGFRREMRLKLQQMPGLSVEIDAHLANLAKVRADIAHLTRRRTLTIDVDMDRTPGQSLGDRIEREAEEASRQVRESMRQIERAFDDLVRRGDFKFPVGLERDQEQMSRFFRDMERTFERYEDEHVFRPGIELDESHKRELKRELDNLIREYNGKNIDLEANAQTFIAARQLQWVSRSRIVDLYVRINEASLTAAATTLAALSGGRLLGEVGEDVWDFFKDLDRNIPSVTVMTTAITNLTGTLLGLATQIVSVSGDLARIGPLFLTLPGFIMGGVASLLVTINAWQNVGDELDALSDPIENLRDMMSDAYWDEARKPITDMVLNLMPQLEVVLTDASRAMGSFGGAFATALERALGGGKLEEIFGTMAEGFRVLEQGADGYAGTIVNLALIAGRYWPRLADWMNRQAQSFSDWLDAIATDGRLDDWMERGIDNLYELGNGLADMGRLMRGITTAAEAAGAAGLAGFHDTMERWQEVINSPNGQRALIDYFEGGRLAAEGLGRAIENIFVPLSRVSDGVRDVLAASGDTIAVLGALFGDVLGERSVWSGMDIMFARMESGLEKLRGSSDEIADFIGAAAQIVGHFADTMAGPLAAALEVVLPRLTMLREPFERLLTVLTDALEDLIRSPQFGQLLDNLVRLVEILIDLAIDAIPIVLPVLEGLLGLLAAIPPEFLLILGAHAVLVGGLFKAGMSLWPLVQQFTGVGGAATGLTGSFKGLSGVLKGVGWATVAAAVVGAVYAIGEAMDQAATKAEDFYNALRTGADSAGWNDLMTGGMFADWGWVQSATEGFRGVFPDWALENAGLAKFLDTVTFGLSPLSRFWENTKNLGDALAQLHREDAAAASAAFSDMAEQFGYSNEALGELIWNSGAYRSELERLAAEMGISTAGMSDAERRQTLLAIALSDTSLATDDVAAAMEAYAAEAEAAVAEVESLLEVQKRLNEEFWTTENAMRDIEAAQDAFEAALAGIDPSLAVNEAGWFNYGEESGRILATAVQAYIDKRNFNVEIMSADPTFDLSEIQAYIDESEETLRAELTELGVAPELVDQLIDQIYTDLELGIDKRETPVFLEEGELLGQGQVGVAALTTGVWSGLPGLIAGVAEWFGLVRPEAQDKFGKAGVAGVGALAGSVDSMRGTFRGSVGALAGLASRELARLESDGRRGGSDMVSGLTSGSKPSAGALLAIGMNVASMMRPFNQMGGQGFGIGAQLSAGIAAGLRSQIAAVARAAASVVNAATRAAKAAGDIRSPSRVWDREIGYQLGAGGAQGLTRSARLLEDAARAAVPLPSGFSFGVAGSAGGDTPVYMDGVGLVAWIRRIANGEARLVWVEGMGELSEGALTDGLGVI